MNEHLATTAVHPLLLEHYELDEVACEAIEAGFNHSYVVTADGQKYVLRVYLNGKYYIRDEGDFRFELDLLDFLYRHEVPVARPVPNRRGKYLTTVALPEETRHLALFHFAGGKGLPDDFQPHLAGQLGQIIATMHRASNQFILYAGVDEGFENIC
jgi:Ser/Thr protein kinase RdoA (MazF antagonist)